MGEFRQFGAYNFFDKYIARKITRETRTKMFQESLRGTQFLAGEKRKKKKKNFCIIEKIKEAN